MGVEAMDFGEKRKSRIRFDEMIKEMAPNAARYDHATPAKEREEEEREEEEDKGGRENQLHAFFLLRTSNFFPRLNVLI